MSTNITDYAITLTGVSEEDFDKLQAFLVSHGQLLYANTVKYHSLKYNYYTFDNPDWCGSRNPKHRETITIGDLMKLFPLPPVHTKPALSANIIANLQSITDRVNKG